MLKYLIILASALLAISCNNTQEGTTKTQHTSKEGSNQLMLASDIEWEMLNPARGDSSPKAGTIWGDRKADVPTGFLAQFVKGFSSPPHIHNVSYRAFVIEGAIHNDDANAEKMWMPPGSYWTQPVGEAHITAANADVNFAYVEIDSGPYLVNPIEEAYDSGERPINIDPSNMVWNDASTISWNESSAEVTFLYDDKKSNYSGQLLKLPAGFKGEIHTKEGAFRAVVIQGSPSYQVAKDTALQAIEPGSSFSSEGESVHRLSSSSESLIYVRSNSIYFIL